MTSGVIDLHAFRLASQKSEEKRLMLLLGLFGSVGIVMLVRYLAGGMFVGSSGLWGTMVILCVSAGCFGGALLMVRSANRAGRLIPSWIWTVGLCIEVLIPTLALLGVVVGTSLPPLRVLSAPAILMYGVFAVATVLRLSPRMSFFYGVLAALGHSGVIVAAIHKAGGVEWAQLPFLATYPIFLFLTGLMAAFVSGELRKHTLAALEAADLKRRAELLQGELRIAREIQQSLFPRQALNIPGFEVLGWCKPATETGGDYYDWCQLPSREGFVMLGDATGHGLGPALLIASCRAYVRADLPQKSDIAGFMNRLNARVASDTDGSRLVTFVGTLLDEKTGQVKLVSAGHCPALLVRAATGTVERINAHGVPLGVMSEFEFPDPAPIPLESGDRLLVYTDGITEAKDPGRGMFGTERLGQAMIRHAKLEGQAFVDALYREAMDFSNNAVLQDDLTLLSIRRL